MGLSIPSERQLDNAIQALKPASFERLLEGYLRIRDPQRFRDLSIIGRNPDDTTRKGWPDAEIRRADGRIECVEFTLSSDWQHHLRNDLRRIQELGSRIASFIFVAWAEQPPRDEEEVWRSRIASLGVPNHEITFLFRKHLLFDLVSPRYARLWTDPLRVPVTSYPFLDLNAAHQLFGSDDLPVHFRPSRAEFLEGRVYRPKLHEILENRLESAGWAFLRGKVASGKTTLATSVGFNRQERPVYYLDFTYWNPADEARAVDTFVTRADDFVLFIFDNVHLESELTRRLFDTWRDVGTKSHLLLVGRETTPRPSHRGYTYPLTELELEALRLPVTAEDLLGVYRRLLQRLRPECEPSVPPKHIFNEWLRLFGGDLLAFSAAVASCVARLSQGDYLLSAEDSKDYISREYLSGLSATERKALNVLAVLAEIELDTTVSSMKGAFPATSVARGLVVRGSDIYESQMKLRLVHPGFGHLLLAATTEPVNRIEIMTEVASADPATGIHLAKRLRSIGRHEEARCILKHIVNENDWPSLPVTPASLGSIARLFGRTGVLQSGKLERRLLEESRFLATLSTTSLQGLASFLHFTQRYMPDLFEAARRVLSEDDAIGHVIVTSLTTRPRLLPPLLALCRKHIPRLNAGLLLGLQKPENIQVLVSNLIEGPLGDLAIFLRESDTSIPSLASALTEALSDAATARRIAARALSESLGPLRLLLDVTQCEAPMLFDYIVDLLDTDNGRDFLVRQSMKQDLKSVLSFLQLTSERLPNACKAISAELINPENNESIESRILKVPIGDALAVISVAERVLLPLYCTLIDLLSQTAIVGTMSGKILDSPPDLIAYAVEFCQDRIPRLHEALVHKLNQPEVIGALAERSIESPLSQLVAFGRIGESARPFFARLDRRWIALRRERISIETLPNLGRFVVALRQHDRPELAADIALDAFVESRDSEWRSEFMLRCLGSFLQAVDTDMACVERFLRVICNEVWLGSQVRRCSPGMLASTLFRVWSALPDDRLGPFKVDCVEKALRYHINLAASRPDDLQGLSIAISLVGIGSTLGFRAELASLELLTVQPLEDIVVLREPPSEVEFLTINEIQLWLGIRILARARIRELRVRSAQGDSFLHRLRLSDTTNQKYVKLNRNTVEWLERCASQGWILSSD